MKINHVGKMTVAAHRGDCYNYYENTMTAFKASIDAGADMIETDIQLTKDSVLVLIHDATVDRTTNGCGAVKDMTFAQLQELNAGDVENPEKIPQLEDIMKLASEKGIMLNLEIKEYYFEGNEERCDRCIEETIALVEKYNMTENILINSFDAYVLEYVYKKYGKKYMLHGFYPYTIMKNVVINPDEYLYCACIFDNQNKINYDYLAERNIEAWIGAGVTQESRLAICSKLGAKLITTNNPSDVLNKLKRLELR